MRLFSRREPLPIAPPRPKIDEIFRGDLGFIVGALLHFGIAPIDVEDAAHEVIRAALLSLSSFDPSRDRRSWLYGVAFNIASHRLRRAGRHRALFVDDAPDVAEEAPTVEEHMIQSEMHRTVREVLDGIDLDRRAVLIARIVHGMTELETAESLSIPIGTVKSRLRLAKRELRDGLQRRERDEAKAQTGFFLLPLGELLANESRIPMVPPAMRARLWEQLQGLLAQPPAPVPANDGGPAPSPPSLSPLRRLLDPEVGRVLGGALVGGALVFALGPIGPPAAPLPTREALAAPLAAVPSASTTPGSAAPTTATISPRATRVSAPAESSSTAAEPADPPASITLLQAATVAFASGDTATARKSLEQHALVFRGSKLGMTRDLLWVRILLSEGKRAEAQAKADAIRKAAPKSPMIQTLDALFNVTPEPSP